MEAALLKQVPLSFSKINLLRLKLQLFRNSKEKLQIINETIAACAAIHTCKSMQHRIAAGCPVCGVIHKGGKMNTQLYVKSKHRETGVYTLILLAEEEGNLQKEKVEQEEIVLENEDEYAKLHAALHYKFLSGVQAWFCAHLARRRAEVADAKLVPSHEVTVQEPTGHTPPILAPRIPFRNFRETFRLGVRAAHSHADS
jgi:hypothetical protein